MHEQSWVSVTGKRNIAVHFFYYINNTHRTLINNNVYAYIGVSAWTASKEIRFFTAGPNPSTKVGRGQFIKSCRGVDGFGFSRGAHHRVHARGMQATPPPCAF